MDLSKVYDPGDCTQNRSELDSHADTCVAGANTTLLWYTDHTVSVSPFIGEYKPLEDVPIATVATAWDNPTDGSTILLIIHEALFFGDTMPHSLLCPNQLRSNGIIVNEPQVFDSGSSHSIILLDGVNLPLHLRGVLSYLPTRKPTPDEIENCQRFELTSSKPWDPTEALSFRGDDAWGPGSIESSNRGQSCYAMRVQHGRPSPPELSVESITSNLDSLRLAMSTRGHHEADVLAHQEELLHDNRLCAISRDSKASIVTSTQLARRWYIGSDVAERTLRTTTQEGMWYVQGQMERRLRTSQAHLRYPVLNVTIYSDTMFPGIKSIQGYTCVQVFTDGHAFVRVYPLKKKADAHHSLVKFIQDVGIPKTLLTDNAPEETRGEWARVVRKYHIKPRTTEPASPWQNRAEAEIREIKKLARRAMGKTLAPLNLWCYALEWAARVRSYTAHDLPFLETRTPEERITGRTPDISEYIHFDWLQWVWFQEPAQFPESSRCLGRWLGVARDVGQAMTYWLLTEKGTIIARSSVTTVSDLEGREPRMREQQELFMSKVAANTLNASNATVSQIFPELIDDTPEFSTPEADQFTPEAYDEYLLAQVVLPIGGELHRGQVVRRKRDHEGRPIGIRNRNPILDTREYEVEFSNGNSSSYMANTIAENLYAQVDQEGRSYALLSEIIDHTYDGTGPRDSGRHTTKGWKFLVAWKDGTTSYVPLREMKNTFLVETADYAIGNQIDKEPAFSWWVPHVVRKRERMISKLKRTKTKYWHKTHKYGI